MFTSPGQLMDAGRPRRHRAMERSLSARQSPVTQRLQELSLAQQISKTIVDGATPWRPSNEAPDPQSARDASQGDETKGPP
jgi:hypothetical protein